MTQTIAIIPARSGSQRVPNKNVRLLAGHPLIAYSIQSARDAGVCDRIIVSTDSPTIADIARDYGAEVPGLRPPELATSVSHDIGFLTHAMDEWVSGSADQLWVIARPTSPLRSSQSIRAARQALLEAKWADSVRALRRVREHPGKMWRIDENGEAHTYLDQQGAFNGPTQDLEPLYIQTSSLEIVRRGAAQEARSIAGKRVLAFLLPDEESVDVNSEMDWFFIERFVAENPGLLPIIERQSE